jgi:hypothetical protein
MMLIAIPKLTLLAQALLASLPLFLFFKWLNKKINPRKNALSLLAWLTLITVSAVCWFLLCLMLYKYWLMP